MLYFVYLFFNLFNLINMKKDRVLKVLIIVTAMIIVTATIGVTAYFTGKTDLAVVCALFLPFEGIGFAATAVEYINE